MNAQWKFIKNFSTNNPGCLAWEIKLGVWRLVVVYNHRDYPGQYIYYIPNVIGDTLLSVAYTEEEAKRHALGGVHRLAAQIIEAVNEVQ